MHMALCRAMNRAGVTRSVVGRSGLLGKQRDGFAVATVQSDKTAYHCFSTDAALENGIATFVEPVPFDAWGRHAATAR